MIRSARRAVATQRRGVQPRRGARAGSWPRRHYFRAFRALDHAAVGCAGRADLNAAGCACRHRSPARLAQLPAGRSPGDPTIVAPELLRDAATDAIRLPRRAGSGCAIGRGDPARYRAPREDLSVSRARCHGAAPPIRAQSQAPRVRTSCWHAYAPFPRGFPLRGARPPPANPGVVEGAQVRELPARVLYRPREDFVIRGRTRRAPTRARDAGAKVRAFRAPGSERQRPTGLPAAL